MLIAGSAAYGFVSGLLGSGNLIKVIMFREMKITKEAFVGAMAATSVMANFAKLASYIQNGLLTTEAVWPATALALGAIAMAYLGRGVLRKLDVREFEMGVRVLLGVAATALLF